MWTRRALMRVWRCGSLRCLPLRTLYGFRVRASLAEACDVGIEELRIPGNGM
jgi:hypothetical protein